EAVGAVGEDARRLLQPPFVRASGDLDVGERDRRLPRGAGGDRRRGGGERVAERLVAELLALAEADQEQALGRDALGVGDEHGGARLGLEVTALEQVGEAAAAGRVEGVGGGRQGAVGEGAGNEETGLELLRMGGLYGKFHRLVPWKTGHAKC